MSREGMIRPVQNPPTAITGSSAHTGRFTSPTMAMAIAVTANPPAATSLCRSVRSAMMPPASTPSAEAPR